jgi:hypothetical protein
LQNINCLNKKQTLVMGGYNKKKNKNNHVQNKISWFKTKNLFPCVEKQTYKKWLRQGPLQNIISLLVVVFTSS